ncbi:MAG: FAD-dependent oxidoreductase [Candidatus Marinimicrobia bacterium]|nr:FAD-dependent oxidoreductase [Candidatus Neomarinimicrobiota bacterium]MBL7022521.1 FAD-dependent oxidoreductase [Candidatus Neomarinimicrobiota bacterium]MBL7108624.1 FAD-dependent oxidoreductase [Candidatus Neomarinimicrobiota bacterium]
MNSLNDKYSQYDVIIIGAGINGCGIAKEFSIRGKKVLVLEKNTIASGTSSKSSRLIHGGLRYLETFQFGLVREALLDRQQLLIEYPNLIKMKPFYLPIYKTSPRSALIVWLGLKLYDILAGKHRHFHSKIISRKEFCKKTTVLKQSELTAVFRYYDAKTNDRKLTQNVAEDAKKMGCKFIENSEIISIQQDNKIITINTKQNEFTSKVLINATGPWIDEVNKKYHLFAHYHIRKISGIHIVIDGILVPDCMFMQTERKQIFFIIPEIENNQTIIGTTEREESSLCDEIKVSEEDVQYLISHLNFYLQPQHKISRHEIKKTFIGIRPLIANKKNLTDLTREYRFDLIQKKKTKLLHIFGGKLTTHPSLAQKVIKILK